MKKWIAGVIVPALVVVGVYWYVNRNGTDTRSQYETIEVSRGVVEVTVSGAGSIEPAATVTIRTAAAGTITSLLVAEGDEIQPGGELFRVDGRPVFALATSAPFYRTLTPGVGGGDVRALQELLRDLGYYDGDIDGDYGGGTREAVRDFLEDRDLDRTSRIGPETLQSVGAPDLGTPVVASRAVKVGDVVQPGGTAMIIRPSGALNVVVEINEVDISQVRTGQKVVVTMDALPDERLTGVVAEVSTGLISSTDSSGGVAASRGGGVAGVVTFPVKIRLDSPSKAVIAGMSADADIVLTRAENVLTVPAGAVQEKDGVTIVLTPGPARDDGTEGDPVPVEVVVGLRSDDTVEILSGLEEGRIVIVGIDVDTLTLPSGGLFSPPGSQRGSGDSGS